MLDFDYAADGCLDPSTYVSALSKACQMLGGQIVTNTSVTGMFIEEVETSQLDLLENVPSAIQENNLVHEMCNVPLTLSLQ